MFPSAASVLALTLYCLSGLRMSVATPLPLPMPLALVAPDFSSRWMARNQTAAFNLARDLAINLTNDASPDHAHSHSGLATSSSSLSRRVQYADKIASLYELYSTARDHSNNLSQSIVLSLPHFPADACCRALRGAISDS